MVLLSSQIVCAQEEENFVFNKNVFYDTTSGIYTDTIGNPFTGKLIINDDEKGIRTETHIAEGLKNGSESTYRDTILISEGGYKDGLPHGELKQYSISGNLRSVTSFADGKLDGLSTSYNEDGAINSEELYRTGRKILGYDRISTEKISTHQPKQYILNVDAFYTGDQKYVDRDSVPITGVVTVITKEERFDMELNNGILHGISRTYHKNGLIRSETTYKNGQKHGLKRIFDAKGNCELQMRYVNDELNGLMTYYTEKGAIVQEIIFRNHNPVAGYFIYSGKTLLFNKDDLQEYAPNLNDR
jgi:antitoxin component YwqK of YwqJK toxin-antitoxin module